MFKWKENVIISEIKMQHFPFVICLDINAEIKKMYAYIYIILGKKI